jgi:hypothetical protein
MRKLLLVKLAIIFMTTLALSGCIWPYWWDDGGYRGGRHHDGGWHDGDRHGGDRDYGPRR